MENWRRLKRLLKKVMTNRFDFRLEMVRSAQTYGVSETGRLFEVSPPAGGDLYHLKKACLTVLTDEEWKALEDPLYEGDVEAFVDTLEVIVRGKQISAQEKVDLLSYVLTNRDSLDYGEDKRNGSGAVEKNIGIHVGRRLKKQGMRWSKQGANNLLALRTEKLNRLWRDDFGS